LLPASLPARPLLREASIGPCTSHFNSAEALLLRAPFDHEQWIPALAATAGATGSASAALMGVTSSGEMQFALSPIRSQPAMREMVRDWVACGGNDPRRNPLAARALTTPVLQEFSDADVISAEERRHHPLWNGFYNRYGLPHFGVCSIWRNADSQILLTLSRTEGQGAIPEGERDTFRSLAKRWHDAATFLRSVKTEGTKLLTGALDGLSIAAVVLDGFGRVVAITQAAQEIVREGRFLHLRSGRVAAVRVGEEGGLDRVVRSCVGGLRNRGRTAVLRLRGVPDGTITLRAWPLPHQNDLAFGAAALLVLESHEAPLLAGCGFTAAEIEIAAAILSGQRVRNIAQRRSATYETVRSQIKSIYSKSGVRSRAEFAARYRA
jgi:DNA-binding CsgD family transcriptional regulator